MFRSLRARLTLTYGVIILIVLVGSLSILVLVARSLPERQVTTRLQQAVTVLLNQATIEPGQVVPSLRQQLVLERADQNFDARILITDKNGKVIYDSRSLTENALEAISLPARLSTVARFLANGLFRDEGGKVWMYAARQLSPDHFLVAASLRPVLNWRTIFNDDLLLPLVRATILAFALALLLSLWMSRWVSAPLQQIASAARSVAEGEYQPITVQGPAEVDNLAHAFNEMVHRVQSSQQSQRDFVANVSHELKTPLTSVQGFAQALMDGTVDDQAGIQQAAGVIYAEAGRMHRMVVDLLELARLDSGAEALQRRSLDLTILLEQLVERFGPQARSAQVSLKLETNPMPAMLGDGDRLVQVFNNLVDNALKHTPAGGELVITTTKEEGWACITFKDSGPGIPYEDQQRIFERFYQVDKARPGGSSRGIGLGLSIAAEIIRAHNGQISVSSQPGQGSVFVVKLPLILPDDTTQNLRKSTRKSIF